jgi:hypothetical protein
MKDTLCIVNFETYCTLIHSRMGHKIWTTVPNMEEEYRRGEDSSHTGRESEKKVKQGEKDTKNTEQIATRLYEQVSKVRALQDGPIYVCLCGSLGKAR